MDNPIMITKEMHEDKKHKLRHPSSFASLAFLRKEFLFSVNEALLSAGLLLRLVPSTKETLLSSGLRLKLALIGSGVVLYASSL
jgi:hypothetical protein